VTQPRDRWQIVCEAADGYEGLRLARESGPDIAILDYSLPQMNGLELTRTIKCNLPCTEILILSRAKRHAAMIHS